MPGLLLGPKIVPTQAVEVDWTHPLANRLEAFYLPGARYGDIARKAPTLAPASAVLRTDSGFGAAVRQAQASGYVSASVAGNLDSRLVSGAGASVWWCGVPLGQASPTSANLPVVAIDSATNSAPYGFMALDAQGARTSGYFAWNSAGTFESITPTVTVTAGERATYCGTLAFGSLATLYLNAVAEGTSSAASTPHTISNDTLFSGGVSFAASDYPNAVTEAFGFWSRSLSAAEVAWLAAEPFGMLRPVLRRVVYVASTGPVVAALAGRAASWSRVLGAASVGVPLAGRAEGDSRAAGAPHAVAAVSGRAASWADAKASATLAGPLSGHATGAAGAHAATAASVRLAGRAASGASASGHPASGAALAGRAVSGAAARGPLTSGVVLRALFGRATSASTARGALSAATPLAGRVTSTSGAGGALTTGAILRALFGRIAGWATARGLLGATKHVTPDATVTFPPDTTSAAFSADVEAVQFAPDTTSATFE